MAPLLNLKVLAGPKAASLGALSSVIGALGGGVAIEDTAGKLLLGAPEAGWERDAVVYDGSTLGWVSAADAAVRSAVTSLLAHLAAKEVERRALASEVLHLYREVNLIEQLSEQLAALLDLGSVARSALDQARRLIAASQGQVMLQETPTGALRELASFGGEIREARAFAGVVIAAGVGQLVNEESAARICVPLRAKQRTVGVIVMANDAGASYVAADLKLLNTIAMQTAAAIENSLLCSEMVNAVRDREKLAAIQKELDTARTIQLSLIPRVFPPFPDRTDFEIHAQMTAARSVGGDFFDFFLIDQDRLGVVIGDVSGKGIPSALYMAVTRTQIKTTALEGRDPAECLQEVNRVLVREKASTMFATCFYGILNTRTGEFAYCNGGHNPPHLLRSATGELEILREEGGLPLGLFVGMPYTGATAQLEPGDALFLFTDGVSEANNDALDEFSDERLEEVVRGYSRLACRELIEAVTRDLLAFTAGAPQSDDITMVALRLHAAGSTEIG